MIRNLTFKNFYSFNDEGVVDFIVNEHAPDTDAYSNDSENTRVTKLLAVIGPNASGKTNVLKALTFLKWLTVSSFNLKPEDDIPFKPFFGSTDKNNSTYLSVEFDIENVIYKYSVELDIKKIISEKFEVKERGYKKLFERTLDADGKKYTLVDSKFGLPNDFEKVLRRNASVIATANQFNHEVSKRIVSYWITVVSNVLELGFQSNGFENVFEAAKFYNSNPDLKNRAEMLLKKFDLGLSGIKIVEWKKPKDKLEEKEESVFFPEGLHVFNGQTTELPFFYESSGTQNLFQLLQKILVVLETGGVAILDEFDANLHPSMLPELTDLFVSKTFNTRNAQLLFSTHHPQILNRLDKYQIIFVEKDENGQSENWRMDDIQGVRTDDNFYAKYMAGVYGAVPKL